MHRIKLIQIGDIHFPEAKNLKLEDIKDRGFPRAISSKVSTIPLQSVLRKIQDICTSGVDGILFCGDLTSRGDLQGYKECITYIDKVLNLSNSKSWAPFRIHVVPGNHDINRDSCDDKDIYKKFDPFVNAWKDLKLNILSIRNFRKTEIAPSKRSQTTIFSLNSCLGCGEKRYLPDEISDELKKIFSDYEKKVPQDKAFKLLGEDLDTPAFDKDDLESICHTIDSLDNQSVPVIVAHHNILPQAIPRVALYTEVLNAGFARSRLAKCKLPVLYCHGHIHDNPIELIQNPKIKKSLLISISAPELVVGFNKITIEYNRSGDPLGCIIVPFRIENDGYISHKADVRIPFKDRLNASQFIDLDMKAILSSIEHDKSYFIDDIRKGVINDGGSFQRKTISEILLEAEWIGLVEIFDRDENYAKWRIRRTQ